MCRRRRTGPAAATFDDDSTADVTDLADWQTEDSKIATVDGGIATGVRAGTTTIDARFDGQTSALASRLGTTTSMNEKLSGNATRPGTLFDDRKRSPGREASAKWLSGP